MSQNKPGYAHSVARVGWIAALLAWLMGGAASLGQPSQSVTLAWKLRPGEVFYSLVDTDVTTTSGPPGMENTVRSRLVMLYRYRVLESKPDGHVLEQSVEEVATNDTTFLGGIYKQFQGLKLKVHFDRNFNVTKIEGHEELLKRVGADDPVVGKFVAELVNENAIRTQIQGEFNFLPDKPVAPGDKWQRQFTFSVGPLGTLTLNQTLTYGGTTTVSGKTLDRIQSAAKASFSPPKAREEFPVRVTKGELQTDEWKGEILFDREAGRLASAQWQAKFKLKLTLVGGKPDGGNEFTMELTQSHVNRVEVSTERPRLPELR